MPPDYSIWLKEQVGLQISTMYTSNVLLKVQPITKNQALTTAKSGCVE